MIEHCGFRIFCDYCSQELFVDIPEWKKMIEKIRSMSWKLKCIDGEWLHICPKCGNGNGKGKDKVDEF